jgi:hypothetical protein
LRIDKPTRETSEQQLSGELPVPYIFIGTPHTIVRASAFQEYPGVHEKGSWGPNGDIERLPSRTMVGLALASLDSA